MPVVDSNAVAVAIAPQPDIDTDPTGGGEQYEYNPGGLTFGANITTTPRNPVSRSRGNRKGTVTDLTSTPEMGTDITGSTLSNLILESFFFCLATNRDLDFLAAAATATGYTVPALTAEQAGKLQWAASGGKSLLFARGYLTAANNGLKVLTENPATAATELVVSGLSVETPPSNSNLAIAGLRGGSGDLSLDVTLGVGTLTSAGGSDFTALGLAVGQYVHLGGDDTANQFDAGVGKGRITAIAATTLTLDRLDSTLATDAGTGKEVDVLFAYFFRDYPEDDANFQRQYIQIEASFPNLGTGGTTRYQYATNNVANVLTLTFPSADKATMNATFVGSDTENPTDTRKGWGNSAIAPNQVEAVNTTSDILRLLMADVDETGLTTDFSDLALSIDNGVTPENVVGTLGAKFLNTANFTIQETGNILFSNENVLVRVRDNTTVAFQLAFQNNDFGMVWDVPEATVNADSFNFAENEKAKIATTINVFQGTLGYSLSASKFTYLPAA